MPNQLRNKKSMMVIIGVLSIITIIFVIFLLNDILNNDGEIIEQLSNDCIFLDHAFNNWDYDTCQMNDDRILSNYPNKLIPNFSELTNVELAELIVSATNDQIVEITGDSDRVIIFETEKGTLKINKERIVGNIIEYDLETKDSRSEKLALEFAENFMKYVEYDLDGSELFQNGEGYSGYGIRVVQKKDNVIVGNTGIDFEFYENKTKIKMKRWYNGLESFEINYDKNEAMQIADKYKISFSVRTNSDLVMCGFQPAYSDHISMNITHDRLVYITSAGSCSVELWEGHYAYYFVLIDPITGKALGLQSGMID